MVRSLPRRVSPPFTSSRPALSSVSRDRFRPLPLTSCPVAPLLSARVVSASVSLPCSMPVLVSCAAFTVSAFPASRPSLNSCAAVSVKRFWLSRAPVLSSLPVAASVRASSA